MPLLRCAFAFGYCFCSCSWASTCAMTSPQNLLMSRSASASMGVGVELMMTSCAPARFAHIGNCLAGLTCNITSMFMWIECPLCFSPQRKQQYSPIVSCPCILWGHNSSLLVQLLEDLLDATSGQSLSSQALHSHHTPGKEEPIARRKSLRISVLLNLTVLTCVDGNLNASLQQLCMQFFSIILLMAHPTRCTKGSAVQLHYFLSWYSSPFMQVIHILGHHTDQFPLISENPHK